MNLYLVLRLDYAIIVVRFEILLKCKDIRYIVHISPLYFCQWYSLEPIIIFMQLPSVLASVYTIVCWQKQIKKGAGQHFFVVVGVCMSYWNAVRKIYIYNNIWKDLMYLNCPEWSQWLMFVYVYCLWKQRSKPSSSQCAYCIHIHAPAISIYFSWS